MTGNTWGAPGAIFISSGTFLLMPHGNVINRYTPAIADLSNMGYGMSFASATASKGLIPNKLIGKVGGGFAMSNAEPQAGGKNIGTEANFSLIFTTVPTIAMVIPSMVALTDNDLSIHGPVFWLLNGLCFNFNTVSI
jgi:hypothetical protein